MSFTSGFESNDFSEWDNAPIGAGLVVNALAALNGTNYGCEAEPSVSSDQATSAPGTAVDYFNLTFYIDKNDFALTVPDTDKVSGIILISAEDTYSPIIKVEWLDEGSGLQLRFKTEPDAAIDQLEWDSAVISGGEHKIQVIVTQASSAVASDGIWEVWIDDTQRYQLTGIDNYDAFAHLYSSIGITSDSPIGGSSGSFFIDGIVLNSNPPPTPSSGFRVFGMDADGDTVYVTGLRDGSELELYQYGLSDLVEDPSVDSSFGTITDADVDAITGGILPITVPGSERVLWLFGLDGNGVYVQENNLNGVAGWTDLSSVSFAAQVVAVFIDPLKPSDALALLANDDIFKTSDSGLSWTKVADGPFNLLTGASRQTNGREVVLVGQLDGEIEYSPNYGLTSTDLTFTYPGAQVDIEQIISNGADDGGIDSTGGFSTNQAFFGVAGNIYELFRRFPAVGIPQGATIISATIEYYSGITFSGTLNMTVAIEDADDPVAVTSEADWTSRIQTTGIAWSVPTFPTGGWVASPDISSDLQTVVDRVGFSETSAVQVFLNYVSGGSRRYVNDYQSFPSRNSRLAVSYTIAQTPGVIYKVEVGQI